MLVKTLPSLETHPLEIIHQTSHRIRIRIMQLGWDELYAQKVWKSVQSIDFVKSVRISMAARSLIIIVEDSHDLTNPQTLYIVFDAIKKAPQRTIHHPGSIQLEGTNSELDLIKNMILPSLTLGLAITIGPVIEISVPVLLTASFIFISASSMIYHAIHELIHHKKISAGLVESMWLSLHTFEGQLIAPALDIFLSQSSATLRDLTARTEARESVDLLKNLGEYWVERDGVELCLSAEQIKMNDIVILSAGDCVPIDGIIQKGTALVDEQNLTGESHPITFGPGKKIYASSILLQGQLFILTEETGINTRAGQVLDMMEKAPVNDTRMGNYAEEIADEAVIPSLFASAGIYAVTLDSHAALSTLQFEFETGLGFTIPSTILAALTYAARNGIYIRSGRTLEKLSEVNTIVFDKTGTLTEATGAIVGIEMINPQIAPMELLSLVASAEQYMTHPVAAAVLNYATEQKVPIMKCETWDYHVGLGVIATVQGKKITVGSGRFMTLEGIHIEEAYIRSQEGVLRNRSVVYVGVDNDFAGVLLYSNAIRPESPYVIKTLKEQGINTKILTGDHARVASAVGYKVGINISNIHSEAFPEVKVAVLKELQDQGKTVAYVGEGINDSAALAYANVSIAMSQGSDIARSTADIVLLNNDLRGLLHAIEISKQTVQVIQQNIGLVVVPSIAAVIGGVFLNFNPITTVIIRNAGFLLAELNALRPLFAEPIKVDEPIPDIDSAKKDEGVLGVPWHKRPKQIFEQLDF